MTFSTLRRAVRATVPSLLLPLFLVASVLAATPWLRSFPASLAGAPLFGAAVVSVLVPLVAARFRATALWLTVLADLVAFAVYALVVVLREPTGVGDLVDGLVHGPSQLLTFALPLVSPRSLMVAPVALVWLAGAVVGECLARRWHTLLPYFGFLLSFGLAYAATQRAAGTDLAGSRAREIVLTALLLATLLLIRAGQAWVRQDETAESTEPDGVLPLRGLATGLAATVVVVIAASLAVQTSVFPEQADKPQRVPSVDQSRPLTPLAFVAGLRPPRATAAGRPVFTVSTDAASTGYFPLANVDFYDGSGWSFTRTFRPSGGVLPADTDPALQAGRELTQRYRIDAGPLTAAPWLPSVYRPADVTGVAVDIDPASGMIVPAGPLRAGTSYTVRSSAPARTFADIAARTSTPDTATPTMDTQLPGTVRATLDQVVQALTVETGTPATPALPFLQAVQRDLRSNYTLSAAAQGSATGAAGSPTPTSPAAATTPTTPAPTSRPTSRSATAATTPARRGPARRSPHTAHGLAARPLPHSSTSAARAGSSGARRPHRARTRSSVPPTRSATPSPTPSRTGASSGASAAVAGSTGFADVLASILGPTRNGTPEQFATLLALIARDLGVPARVATGFRIEPRGRATTLAAGRYDVTTADAWSWVEIPVNGAGWLVLDGSPGRFSKQAKATESGAPPPSSSAVPSKNALITQGSSGNAVAPKSRVPSTGHAPTHALLIAIIAALALLLVVVLAILLLRKRLRAARRRRCPDPRLRLIGAWRENLDVLAEAGLPELTSLTSAEIARLTADQFGADPGAETAALGIAANSAAYSPSTVVADDDAAAAWVHVHNVRRQISRQLGVRGRIATGLRYHRGSRSSGPVSPPSWNTAADRPARRGDGPSGRYRGRRRAH